MLNELRHELKNQKERNSVFSEFKENTEMILSMITKEMREMRAFEKKIMARVEELFGNRPKTMNMPNNVEEMQWIGQEKEETSMMMS